MTSEMRPNNCPAVLSIYSPVNSLKLVLEPSLPSSLFLREFVMEHNINDIIDLQQGWPSPRLVPVQQIATASQALLAEPDIALRLMYGPDGGEDSVREQIAHWLSRFYRPATGLSTPDRISITNGASNALATILQVCTDPCYTLGVCVVEPTYFLGRKIFLDAGFVGRMHGIPGASDGIDLVYWRWKLEQLEADSAGSVTVPTKKDPREFPKLYRHVLYLVPTNSNPTGTSMSYSTRLSIVQLAREFDVLVIADDVYDFLRWPMEEKLTYQDQELPPPRIVDIDGALEGAQEFGNSVSNGSFSKIVAPGLRVGWVEATPAFTRILQTA